MYKWLCNTCTNRKKYKFLYFGFRKKYTRFSYVCTSLDMVAQSTHHPVLILKPAKKACRLPRNVCDNITTVTKKVCRLGMIRNNF